MKEIALIIAMMVNMLTVCQKNATSVAVFHTGLAMRTMLVSVIVQHQISTSHPGVDYYWPYLLYRGCHDCDQELGPSGGCSSHMMRGAIAMGCGTFFDEPRADPLLYRRHLAQGG